MLDASAPVHAGHPAWQSLKTWSNPEWSSPVWQTNGHRDSRPEAGRHHRPEAMNSTNGIRANAVAAKVHPARGWKATLRIGN